MGMLFKSGLGLIEPIVTHGQNVAMHLAGKTVEYRQITWYEAIPPFQCIDVGAIAAQTVSARTNVTNLEVGDNEFAQYRWFPIDNMQVRLFLPPAIAKGELRNLQVAFGPNIVDLDPCLHLTEFCVWQDTEPAVECINFMDYALAASRIMAFGIRYETRKIEDPGLVNALKNGAAPCSHIYTAGRFSIA